MLRKVKVCVPENHIGRVAHHEMLIGCLRLWWCIHQSPAHYVFMFQFRWPSRGVGDYWPVCKLIWPHTMIPLSVSTHSSDKQDSWMILLSICVDVYSQQRMRACVCPWHVQPPPRNSVLDESKCNTDASHGKCATAAHTVVGLSKMRRTFMRWCNAYQGTLICVKPKCGTHAGLTHHPRIINDHDILVRSSKL